MVCNFSAELTCAPSLAHLFKQGCYSYTRIFPKFWLVRVFSFAAVSVLVTSAHFSLPYDNRIGPQSVLLVCICQLLWQQVRWLTHAVNWDLKKTTVQIHTEMCSVWLCVLYIFSCIVCALWTKLCWCTLKTQPIKAKLFCSQPPFLGFV